ncbi:Major facilitator superfamily MFS_1 [metagenome]|uniref:Major facilitator superfamily MFS_1 n=1 Tax=metagenome TaxID=256318 RepID=A0A2P2C764_9ZZZZ
MGLVRRLDDIVAPRRLGTPFRWLLGSSWTSNLGDGIALAAGPLLVASQTRDPLLVALAVLLQQLPWLVFGLYAGALADRLDRKLVVIAVDLARAVVLMVLAGSIVTGQVSIAIVLGAMFLLGTAETFADTTSQTLLPMVVHRDDLPIANSRLMAGYIVANELAGPPLGAALFAAGLAWPFVLQAVLVLMGAGLISRMLTTRPERTSDTHLRSDIAEGFRWLWGHPAIRTLAITIFTFNVTYGAAWSVLVLYADDRLGLGEVGFGLITTASALGGLLGTGIYGWLTSRVSLGNIMRAGLVLETFTHLGLALTRSGAVAMAIFFVFGAHAFIWGTTSTSIRQRAVPEEFQGRVGSVSMMALFGGLVLGSGIGGVIARTWGVTAPFWFGFIGSAVFVVLIWKQLSHIAHDDEALRSPS